MNTVLKNNEQFYKIPNYTIKCRLYPNKTQAKCIDKIIHGVQVAYNNTNYDVLVNKAYIKEYKTKDGGTLHYVDYDALIKKEHLDVLREQHHNIKLVPGGALSGKSGLFRNDYKNAMSHKLVFKTDGNGNPKKTRSKKTQVDSKGRVKPYSIEESEPTYYTKSKKRTSYTYQASVKTNITQLDNPNVFYIKLVNVGIEDENGKIKSTPVKVRAWNQKLRFGDGSYNFIQWCKNLSKSITITISKDNCNDYYICFKLADVFKPMTIKNENKVGVDVGIKDIAILSDGTKFENKKFKKEKEKHIKKINKQLSRRQGWSNQDFRKSYQQDKTLKCSKRYEKTKLYLARLNKKLQTGEKIGMIILPNK